MGGLREAVGSHLVNDNSGRQFDGNHRYGCVEHGQPAVSNATISADFATIETDLKFIPANLEIASAPVP